MCKALAPSVASHERYEVFDQTRREAEHIQADADDLRKIEQLEHTL